MRKHLITSTSKPEAAKAWLSLGVQVLPQLPAQKHAPFPWDPWLDGLDDEKIDDHWSIHPDHDLAIIPGDQLVVLDADTNQALAALKNLESAHQLQPSLYVGTRKGQHHYFRIPEGVSVKANSHSTEQHPERIDVRTGRHQVVVAPSTNKRVIGADVTDIASMVAVTQAFIDDLMAHNGQRRSAIDDSEDPEPPSAMRLMPDDTGDGHLSCVKALLNRLDPEEGGYDLWCKTLMAVYTTTDGEDQGLDIADDWSSTGASYEGRRSIENKWRGFRVDGGITIGTIFERLAQEGLYWAEVCDEELGEPFEIVDVQPLIKGNLLERFDVCRDLDAVRQYVQDLAPVLPPIAMLGQATAIYASPNTGKTLLSLHMVVQGVLQGHIKGENVYYINCDDSARGIVEKGEILQPYGVRMIANGHYGFKPSELPALLRQLIASGAAKGQVLILDTLKKFTDTMNKGVVREFGIGCRTFCMAGGTIITLGHNNKNRDAFGQPVYSGTTDVVDDFDCVYMLDGEDQSEGQRRKVCFTNKKHRGGVPMKAAFSYSIADGLTYRELFDSVRNEESFEVETQQGAKKPKASSEEVIFGILDALNDGVVTKVNILKRVMDATGAARAFVESVLAKHTGGLWQVTKGSGSSLVYQVLEEDLEALDF